MTFSKWVATIARYISLALLFFIVLIAFGGSLYKLFTHESIVIRHFVANSAGFTLVILALCCFICVLTSSIKVKEGENEKEKA
ncbi:hypothetical protein [Bacillus pumilus]|uniref:hypothetical protein n=1 Tax=Bacillus pumilus TaxID=1408 RepID=UPI0007EEE95A|nr:hypothetical protein [Bacillus pumilus]OBS86772.1 hypothetical protein BAY68_16570 [Bacillus pumilus]